MSSSYPPDGSGNYEILQFSKWLSCRGFNTSRHCSLECCQTKQQPLSQIKIRAKALAKRELPRTSASKDRYGYLILLDIFMAAETKYNLVEPYPQLILRYASHRPSWIVSSEYNHNKSKIKAVKSIQQLAWYVMNPEIEVYVGPETKNYRLPKESPSKRPPLQRIYLLTACFTSAFIGSHTQSLTLDEDKVEWYEILLEYMYSGKIPPNSVFITDTTNRASKSAWVTFNMPTSTISWPP